MVLATTFGGLLMWAVHKVATGSLSESEYSAFGMFLRVLNLMSIPACGLQAVFARQAAVALDEEGRSRLSALVRGAVRLISFSGLSVLWSSWYFTLSCRKFLNYPVFF